MLDSNTHYILQAVSDSNWIEMEGINIDLFKSIPNSEKKKLHIISLRPHKIETEINGNSAEISHIGFCDDDQELYAKVCIKEDGEWILKIIPFTMLQDKHVAMIAELLSHQINSYTDEFTIKNFSSHMWEKYKRYRDLGEIKCVRTNFIFLKDHTFIYDYNEFNDHIDAIIDAVNCNLYRCRYEPEDLGDLVSLIYLEKQDFDAMCQKIRALMR